MTPSTPSEGRWLISPQDRASVEERLRQMENPVQLIHFTRHSDCSSCREAEQLVREVAQFSANLSLEVFCLPADRAEGEQYGIRRVPATVVRGAKDCGIRIYGLPAGYEFAVLLETILLISRGSAFLPPEVRSSLAKLTGPVHLQTFSTPTCPYCPGMAILANKMAMESELVRSDLLDATEYPDLVRAHAIRSVPKTILNGTVSVDGAVSSQALASAILRAVSPPEQSTSNLNWRTP